MNTYCVTFGQQYRQGPHPKVRYAHPDGWLTIEAESEGEARDKAFSELGQYWSFLYEEGKFEESKHYFPLGELHRIS